MKIIEPMDWAMTTLPPTVASYPAGRRRPNDGTGRSADRWRSAVDRRRRRTPASRPRTLPAHSLARQNRAMQRAVPGGNAEGLFRSDNFMRLWLVGGLANALRWLEVLAASLFTLDATGSELAVAAVAAARSLPLLLMGGFAGVLADALDRKRIVVGGMLLTAASSAVIVVLGCVGALQPWHLFAGSLVSGLVYGTEMSARRRMLAESVAPPQVARAVALDSLTS